MATVKKIVPKKVIKSNKSNEISKVAATTAENKKIMLECLRSTLGLVTQALKKAKGKVVRSTFYEWLKDDAEFKTEVEAIQEQVIDFVESCAYMQIKKGDSALIKFFLTSKAKKRGYAERTETDIRITKVGMDIEEEVYEQQPNKIW